MLMCAYHLVLKHCPVGAVKQGAADLMLTLFCSSEESCVEDGVKRRSGGEDKSEQSGVIKTGFIYRVGERGGYAQENDIKSTVDLLLRQNQLVSTVKLHIVLHL